MMTDDMCVGHHNRTSFIGHRDQSVSVDINSIIMNVCYLFMFVYVRLYRYVCAYQERKKNERATVHDFTSMHGIHSIHSIKLKKKKKNEMETIECVCTCIPRDALIQFILILYNMYNRMRAHHVYLYTIRMARHTKILCVCKIVRVEYVYT